MLGIVDVNVLLYKISVCNDGNVLSSVGIVPPIIVVLLISNSFIDCKLVNISFGKL